MKISELKKKSPEDLHALLQEKRGHIDELKFLLYQKKTNNVRELREEKKDIARILTLMGH